MQRVRRWTIRPSANGSRGCASRPLGSSGRGGGEADDPRPLAQQAFAGTPPAGLAEFARNPRAADYARFRAEVERRGSWWGAWPDAERDGSLPGDPLETIARATTCTSSGWRRSSSPRRPTGRRAGGGLMLDLPIGVNGAGYDVWRERSSFAPDAAAGAPPDAFWSQGQDWGAPHRIRTGARGRLPVPRRDVPDVVPLRRDRADRPRDRAASPLLGPARRGARDGVYVRYRAGSGTRSCRSRRTRPARWWSARISGRSRAFALRCEPTGSSGRSSSSARRARWAP